MADPTSPEPATSGVFISYASGDLDRVRGIVAALGRAGVPVWLDRDGIPGGANYGPEIVAAIRASRAVVLCCTVAAFASRNVRQEVVLAWDLERPLLPLLLEQVTIPDELAYWLDAAQWVEVLDRSADEWLPPVLRALQRYGVTTGTPDPSASPEGPRNADGAVRLPTPLTALLGRDAEVAEITRLLADHRLVTLTGPGGVGKTRLAIEAARAAVDAFPVGAAFVDLTPIRDAEAVLPAVARVLHVRDAGSASPIELLAAAIGDRHVLLVLDNLEQVLDAAPDIAALLSQCPRLVVLATSRAPLGIRGEHIVVVEPLAVPDATVREDLTRLAASPAVALFSARTGEARAGFALTAENAGAVAAICARLDGLPLAIELAAARTRLLSPSALLARLERRLPALTGGARDLPARQQTLRDTIAWSHELLAPEERTLLHRLGFFSGGWTFEAAEAVGNHDGSVDVLSALDALVAHSLVRQDDAGSETRFGMLETIREYALEQVGVEEPAVRAAHAAYVLALTERIDPRHCSLAGPPPALVDTIARELDNARSALAWLLEKGATEDALLLAACLVDVWYTRDSPREGLSWLDRTLAADADPPVDLHATALMAASALAHALGSRRAVELARRSIALWDEAGDHPAGRAYALAMLALAHDNVEEFDLSDRAYDDAIAAYEAIGDAAGLGIMLSNQAQVRYERGDDRPGARQLAMRALDLQLAGGHPWGLAIARNNLGRLAVEDGDYEAALRQYVANLLATGAHGDKHLVTEAVYWIGVVAQRRGFPRQATRLLGAAAGAESLFEMRVTRLRASLQAIDAALADAAAELGKADFERASAEGRALALREVEQEALALANELLAQMSSAKG